MPQSTLKMEELRNLFRLLDDESPEIQKVVQTELHRNSLEIILNKSWFMDHLPGHEAAALDSILRASHEAFIFSAFQQLTENALEDIDLEKSVLLISYWNDPTVNCQAIREQLDQIAADVRALMPGSGHPLAYLDHMNYVLFSQYRFTGNSRDYYNPENSYIDRVMKTRKGIPITLAIIYLLVARRLYMPIYGVSMPAHFILKFNNGEDEIFFDPYYEGKVYSRQECYNFLISARNENPEKVLAGCDNYEIVKRVLRNLRLVYSSYYFEPEKIHFIEQILNLLDVRGAIDSL
ncbi:MAG: hypothetical protein GXO78_04320 [Calditrichaeota bacterium]|nr:hypothetical protein [Calditrichota bacterium]